MASVLGLILNFPRLRCDSILDSVHAQCCCVTRSPDVPGKCVPDIQWICPFLSAYWRKTSPFANADKWSFAEWKTKIYRTGENMEKSSGDNRINIRAKWSTKIMSRRDSKPDHPTHNPGGTSDPRLLFQKAWHFGVKILVFSKPNSKFHLLVFPPCTFKKRVTTSGTRTRHNVTRSQGSCAGSRIKFESLARRAPHILGVRPCSACRCRSCFDSAGDPLAL